MKLAAITSILAAVSVSATPAAEPQLQDLADRAVKTTCGVNAFNLMSLRSASPIHFGSFSASQGDILINLPKGKQAAICDGNPQGQATFFIKDGGLYLYHAGNGKKQQIFVDRSGMGQGKIGYIDEGTYPGKNSELKGWKSTKEGDYSYLSFKGETLLACPGAKDKSWEVWMDVGVKNPGGNKGCLGLSAMVLHDADPVSCKYSKPT